MGTLEEATTTEAFKQANRQAIKKANQDTAATQYLNIRKGFNPPLEESLAGLQNIKDGVANDSNALRAVELAKKFGGLTGPAQSEILAMQGNLQSLAGSGDNTEVGYGLTVDDLTALGIDPTQASDRELHLLGNKKQLSERGDLIDKLMRSGKLDADSLAVSGIVRDLAKEKAWTPR